MCRSRSAVRHETQENFWPEPRAGPYNAEQKDRLETWAARMACARRVPLAVLQHRNAPDWISLCRAAGGASSVASYAPDG